MQSWYMTKAAKLACDVTLQTMTLSHSSENRQWEGALEMGHKVKQDLSCPSPAAKLTQTEHDPTGLWGKAAKQTNAVIKCLIKVSVQV